MNLDNTLILNTHDVLRKIRRIAFEMKERYYTQKNLTIISVAGQGTKVAQAIIEELKNTWNVEITSLTATVNKRNPERQNLNIQGDVTKVSGSSCIVIDDVINSGRTLMYVCSKIMELQPQEMSTAVIIDRFHRTYPIKADFVGLTLSTNLKENVSLKNENGSFSVWLEG